MVNRTGDTRTTFEAYSKPPDNSEKRSIPIVLTDTALYLTGEGKIDHTSRKLPFEAIENVSAEKGSYRYSTEAKVYLLLAVLVSIISIPIQYGYVLTPVVLYFIYQSYDRYKTVEEYTTITIRSDTNHAELTIREFSSQVHIEESATVDELVSILKENNISIDSK